MRRACLLTLAWAILSLAYADRLIEIPTGRLIYPERLTLEAGFLTGSPERERALVSLRIGGLLELQGARTGFENRLELYGVQYSLYPEIPGYAPGISVGVADVFDRSPQGRGYYLAISYGIAALGANAVRPRPARASRLRLGGLAELFHRLRCAPDKPTLSAGGAYGRARQRGTGMATKQPD
jgi:hypothetical protein